MNKVCCFIGHREISVTEELKSKLKDIIENLINKENFGIFFFGGFGEFDDLCHEVVTALKKQIFFC